MVILPTTMTTPKQTPCEDQGVSMQTTTQMSQTTGRTNRRNNYWRNDLSVIGSDMKHFAGETLKLDAVLRLIIEKLNK